MTKLVIFDLDGTLLNTIQDLGTACNHALSLHGFPTHEADEYPKLVGNGVNKLIERALPLGHKDEATVLRIKPDFISFYNEHNRVHTRPYEGIPEVLLSLKKRGILLAVASNKYDAATKQLIEHYFGADFFDVVLGERPGVERKPNPQIVFDIFTLLKSHSITPQETLYIGDSDVDIKTAQNAHIESVACAWGFCSEAILTAHNPDHIIHLPSEILTHIQ